MVIIKTHYLQKKKFVFAFYDQILIICVNKYYTIKYYFFCNSVLVRKH